MRSYAEVTAGLEFASIDLRQVVPWGRSLNEYVHMFDLTDGDL